MKLENLKKANELSKKITELEEALSFFECKEEHDTFLRNPTLIIEFDADGCLVEQRLPINLSNELIGNIKSEIRKCYNAAINEFNEL